MTAGIPVGAFPYNVIPDVDYAVWQSDCFKIRAESKSFLSNSVDTVFNYDFLQICLLYTSPSPRD